MLDSRDIQKRRQEGQLNIYKEPWLDDTMMVVVGAVVAGCIFIAVMCILVAITNEENQIDCEAVGGKYRVVDRSFAGKTVVDIYGCVK